MVVVQWVCLQGGGWVWVGGGLQEVLKSMLLTLASLGNTTACLARSRASSLHFPSFPQELMDGGSLFDILNVRIKSTGERAFGWYNRGRVVALAIARALHHLHR